MTEKKESLGTRLKSFRRSLGLSQSDFGEQLGVVHQTILLYENGKRIPDGNFFIKFSEIYNVSLDWLVLGKGEMYLTDINGLFPDVQEPRRSELCEMVDVMHKVQIIQHELMGDYFCYKTKYKDYIDLYMTEKAKKKESRSA